MTADASITSGLLLTMGIIVSLFFAVYVVIMAIAAVKGLAEWSSNNKQPVVTLPVTVVAKRTSVSRGSDPGLGQIPNVTRYVTFQLPDGSRKEYSMLRGDSDAITEGDQGAITMQGTRFKGFRPG